MEKIVQLPYDQIALTGVPADSTDVNNPAWRVPGSNYSITQDGAQPAPGLQRHAASTAAAR